MSVKDTAVYIRLMLLKLEDFSLNLNRNTLALYLGALNIKRLSGFVPSIISSESMRRAV